MADHTISAFLEEYATALGPDGDEVLAAMDAQAERESFPHVGPAVGGWLAMCARFAGAERVFQQPPRLAVPAERGQHEGQVIADLRVRRITHMSLAQQRQRTLRRADLMRVAREIEGEPSLRGLSPHLLAVCRSP